MDRDVEGVVEMMLDAIQRWRAALAYRTAKPSKGVLTWASMARNRDQPLSRLASQEFAVTSEPSAKAPLIVGVGGTTRPGSTSERVLVKALEAAEARGARTRLFGGALLSQIPIYDPATADGSPEMQALIEGVREADGVIICTPGYHGSMSGVIKNALDALEGLRGDVRPYFDGRAVGCIVTADGGQAGGTALSALRTVIHALRGWPTPMGVSLNGGAGPLFNAEGGFTHERDAASVALLAGQVVDFALMKAAVAASA
jgi:FMN reductase